MQSFFPSRGCVYAVNMGQGSAQGGYELKGLPKGSADAPILIKGVSTEDTDVVLPVITLNGKKILYRFGQDFGGVRITCMALLGTVDANSTTLSSVIGFFNSSRISMSPTPVNLSLPGGSAYKVYLTGLAMAEPDPEFNIQYFMLSGTIAEKPA